MQNHKIIVHYHGDGGQACIGLKKEAMLDDHEGILRLFQLISYEQGNLTHYCPNKGVYIEIVPQTRGSTKTRNDKICYECYAQLDENGRCPTKMCKGY
jgi:hypothetical protein